MAFQLRAAPIPERKEPMPQGLRDQLIGARESLPRGLRDQLIGAWMLESYVEESVDGSQHFEPLGTTPRGIIMYTPDGYMSAQLAKPERPDFASGDWFDGTPDDYANEATSYIAYTGPFHVDEERQTLTHSMFVSLFPDWTGQTQPRAVQIEGDTLRLGTVAPLKSSGRTVNARITWKRAEPN